MALCQYCGKNLGYLRRFTVSNHLKSDPQCNKIRKLQSELDEKNKLESTLRKSLRLTKEKLNATRSKL